MTAEKAIEILSDVGDINRCCAEDAEALDMAIKVLEQQSCEDCISREATIDAIYKKYIGGKGAIKNAPINDLSRACNAIEVYSMAIITAALATE